MPANTTPASAAKALIAIWKSVNMPAVAQSYGTRPGQVSADTLRGLAVRLGQSLPALPIALAHAVLNRQNRIVRCEPREVFHLLIARARLAFALIDLVVILEELGRRA